MDSNFKNWSENELLLSCARTEINARIEGKIRSLIKYDLDWDYIIRMATGNSLIQLLYFNLMKIDQNDIPPWVIDNLEESFVKNSKINIFLWNILLEYLQIFKEHEIGVIAFRGPVLSITAYDSITLRQFSDLDLLVVPEQVGVSKEVLIEHGFVPELNLSHRQEKKFIESRQEYTFRGEKGVVIDLHWKLNLLHYNHLENDLFAKENLQEYVILDEKITSIAPEEMLLQLCIHNSSHRWPLLSQICDISEFIKKQNLNWNMIRKEALNRGINRIVNINLYLCELLYELELPVDISDQIQDDNKVEKITTLIIEGLFDDRSNYGLFFEIKMLIILRDNLYLGIRDVLNALFIPTAYEWKNIQLPARMSFIYHIIRPFLLLTRIKL